MLVVVLTDITLLEFLQDTFLNNFWPLLPLELLRRVSNTSSLQKLISTNKFQLRYLPFQSTRLMRIFYPLHWAIFFHFIDSIFSFSLGIVLQHYWLVGSAHLLWGFLPNLGDSTWVFRAHAQWICFFNFFKEPFAHYQKPCQFLSTPSRTRTHTLTSVVLCALHYTIGA